jgi:molecular chaperone GrpE
MSDDLEQESLPRGREAALRGGKAGKPENGDLAKDEAACECAKENAHLLDELAEAKALADEHLHGWKRAMADYANLKKETEAARADVHKFACVSLAAELLPVLDSFRKASQEKPEDSSKLAQWADGIARIRDQFESIMRKAGVEAIDKTGVPFDPNIHEAMSTKSVEGVPPDQVVEVLIPGYRMHDRVIRAAKVVVSS